jgi:hypothetical protein
MKYTSFTVAIMVVMMGCGKVIEHSMGPISIGNDPWNDLTSIGTDLYITNYDGNEGPGDRIYLYQVDTLGVILDSVNLRMNGQGYLSIATDGAYFFLVGHTFGNRFRVTMDGEMVAFSNSEPQISGWEQGGIAYDSDADSLYVLMWDTCNPSVARIYSLDKITMRLRSYDSFQVEGGRNYFAMTYHPDHDAFYLLCQSETVQNMLLLMRYDPVTGTVAGAGFLDNEVRGIAYWNGELIASTAGRQLIFVP